MCYFFPGDVQIGLMDKRGQLEVEVIRARGLTSKPGSKSLPGNAFAVQMYFLYFFLVNLHVRPSLSSCPAPYVKVYLLEHGTCKAKKKTKIARKTLEPLYQQHLLFEESPQGKVLQVQTNQHLVHPRSRAQYICMIAVEIMEDHSLPEGEIHLFLFFIFSAVYSLCLGLN